MYLNRIAPSSLNSKFDRVFQRNLFNGISSRSGQGSSVDQTQEIARLLPAVILELNISSVFDIPCGDLEWMSKIDLDGIAYLGSDISPALIEYLKTTYLDKQFTEIDICKDSLPKVDLIFCRDLFVHLSYRDIKRALKNIRKSDSKYLATTTFSNRTKNRNLPIFTRNIAWRTLNLEISPFNLAPPIYLLEEKCTEGNGLYSDKAIEIWRISDI